MLNFIIGIITIFLCGTLIGYERQCSSKVIGVRTCILIILGAFLFTYISTVIGGDPARITAQVASGVGFIGAGIIFKNGTKEIIHLTTAVLVWTLAALGCLIALSLWLEVILVTIVIYCVLRFKLLK
jgi:putative Mg2+ transporter-C (MgtC) family protein